MKKNNTVALEDLVTEVLTYFCEHVYSLGYKDYKGKDFELHGWYLHKLSPKQKRNLSDKLLTIMEKDMKKVKGVKHEKV